MKKSIFLILWIVCMMILSGCSHKCIVDVCENKAKHTESYCDEHIAFISETTTAMEKLCIKYQLSDFDISFNFPPYSSLGYSINIEAKSNSISEAEMASFMDEVQDYRIDGWWRTIGDTIRIDNANYDWSKDKLSKDGEIVYSSVTPAPKVEINLDEAIRIPYDGMDASWIELTDLGEADEIEYCRDYSKLRPERRSITYRWYYDNGKLAFHAFVLNGEVVSVTDFRK